MTQSLEKSKPTRRSLTGIFLQTNEQKASFERDFAEIPFLGGKTKKSCRRSVLGWLELRETLHKRFHKKSRNLKKTDFTLKIYLLKIS